VPVEIAVAPPIRNEIDDHLLSDHAIDEAIGFKKNLPIFLVPQGPKLIQKDLVVIGLFRSIHLSTCFQNTLGIVESDLLGTLSDVVEFPSESFLESLRPVLADFLVCQ